MPRLICHLNPIQPNIKKPSNKKKPINQSWSSSKPKNKHCSREAGKIERQPRYLLVDGFQRSRDRQVILEFYRDALICERFEN